MYVASEVKVLSTEAEGRPSVNSAYSPWRTEPTSVEKGGDELWLAVKFQSNSDIAGSHRNSFRASLRIV